MKSFQIKDINGIRYFPAVIYRKNDINKTTPIIEEETVHELLIKDHALLIVANCLDQQNEELPPFQGELTQEQIVRIFEVDYWKDEVNLDMIMSLSEAAEKWGLADGASIRMAIDRGRFKPNEIKRCGHVWIVTYPGMQRVFGPIEDRKNDLSLSHTEIVALVSQILGECITNTLWDLFHPKAPSKGFSHIPAAIRLKELVNEALACIDKGGRIIVRLHIIPNSSVIKNILHTRAEFLEWLDRIEYTGMKIEGKLKDYLLAK